MKTFKKIIASLMVAVMMITAAPLSCFTGLELFASAATPSGSCGTNVRWSFDSSTGVLSITGSGEMFNFTYDYKPWYSFRSYIKSVTVGSGITKIGSYAFHTSTTMNPDSITSVTLPDTITSIGDYAFGNCNKLSNITIPTNVKTIGYSAFANCESITNISIPASVTDIGSEAFKGCNRLTNITVSSSNSEYSSDGYGVLFNKNQTQIIKYPPANTRTTYIIPDTVTSIASYAFDECYYLKRFNTSDNNTNYSCDEYGVLFNKDKTVLILYPKANTETSYVIPDTVTNVGAKSFHKCTDLTSVTISGSVTSIGDYAFNGCTGLTGLIIPDDVTSIGNYAFYNCTGLTSITIPDSVISIGDDAFSYCRGLTSVTIGNSVEIIGDYAFFYCTGLTSVTIGNSVTSIGDSAFYKCIHLTSIKIPNRVTSIGDSAFSECTRLGNVTIGNNVISIGEGAFYNCDTLISIKIPNRVTSIGDSAFLECNNLKSVTIGNSVAKIGEAAFYWCDSLIAVCYNGTEEQWKKITIGSKNNLLRNATIYFSEHKCDYTAVVTEATCTEQGYTTYTCECGDSYEADYIPKIDHNSIEWEYDYDNGQKTRDCEHCDYTESKDLGRYGDINGDGKTNSSDALKILQYSVGMAQGIDKRYADINRDSFVNSSDALIALQISTGNYKGDLWFDFE